MEYETRDIQGSCQEGIGLYKEAGRSTVSYVGGSESMKLHKLGDYYDGKDT